MNERAQEYAKEVLREDWDIFNKKDLLETVEYMSEGPGFVNCQSQGSRAWQLCRSMQLLGMSFAVGWSDRKDMIERSCKVGRKMQEYFRSWDELCEGFLEGFYAWQKRVNSPDLARANLQERIDIHEELKARPDSPYKLNWYFPLDLEALRRRERQFGALEK